MSDRKKHADESKACLRAMGAKRRSRWLELIVYSLSLASFSGLRLPMHPRRSHGTPGCARLLNVTNSGHSSAVSNGGGGGCCAGGAGAPLDAAAAASALVCRCAYSTSKQ